MGIEKELRKINNTLEETLKPKGSIWALIFWIIMFWPAAIIYFFCRRW